MRDLTDPAADAPIDADAAFAEGAITFCSNILTLMGTHLLEMGTPRQEVLDIVAMLHETNQETIQSPRARAVTSRHLRAVYRVLAEEL